MVRRAPQLLATGALGTVAWLGAACVTTVLDDSALTPAVEASPILVPIGGDLAADRPLVEFYESLLGRLHLAHGERDLVTMRALLAQYQRSDVPEWAQQRLHGFDALAAGLEFELHAAAHSTLVPVGDAADGDEIGEERLLELVLEPLPGAEPVLGGADDDDPVAFAVRIEIEDRFVDGSSRQHQDGGVVRLPAAFCLQRALHLPVRLALADSGAVDRSVDVRVDLLPGYVHHGDLRAPVRRTTLTTLRLQQWPRGFQPIQQQPLRSLRAAMQIGDAAHFPHVWLAGRFAAAADAAEVERLLIDWIRLGRPDQAQLAMVVLRDRGAARIPVGDRDGWLDWWRRRR